MPQFLFTIILLIITLGVSICFSKFIYHMCLFNFIKIIVGAILTLSALFFLSIGEWKIAGTIALCSIEFVRRFFVYTQSDKYKRHSQFTSNAIGVIFSPIAFTLKGGIKMSKYAIQVADGTISEKRKLKKDRMEFEYEKQAFKTKEDELNQEWEKIKKAWDKLFEAREAFARQKDGTSSKEDYFNNKSYKESYQKAQSSQQARNKKSTGRYFKEWEKFDLNDFNKNSPYEILNINTSSTKKDIIMAWKKIISQFHPDKFAHEKDIDKLKEAEQIAQLINWAKGRVMK